MNSNSENTNELSFLIPDYLEGNVTDSVLLKKIELKIQSDDAFRKEVEDFRTSISFLNSAGFQEPGQAYFNNLLPRINSRIESKQRNKGFLDIFRFSRIWKYAVTVVPLLLLFIIYKSYFIDNTTPVISDSSVTSYKQENKKISENNILLDSGLNLTSGNEVSNINKKDMETKNSKILFEKDTGVRNENSSEKEDLSSYNWLIDDEEITSPDEDTENDIEINLLKSDEQEEFLLNLKTEIL